MQNLQLITRELINEMLTPEEEREWMTYTAQLPRHEIEEAREHLVSAGVITQALVRLMNEGATPQSEAVQKLYLRNNQLMLKYRFRERLLTRRVWSATVAKKVHALGHRLVLKSATAEASVTESEVLDFCRQARNASEWGKALDEIDEEALTLAARHAEAHSHDVQALARRLTEVCERYSLGDPALYGRWFIEFGKVPSAEGSEPVNERHREAWMLLVEAVEALRQPAGMQAAAAW